MRCKMKYNIISELQNYSCSFMIIILALLIYLLKAYMNDFRAEITRNLFGGYRKWMNKKYIKYILHVLKNNRILFQNEIQKAVY